jgi:hypothetical protein
MHRRIILACVLILAGCGGGAVKHPQQTKAQARVARMEVIVRSWSAHLNAGDNAGVARLFRVPVLMTQGQYVFRLVTLGQVARWHAALPCSGRIVSVGVKGRVATAVFRLGNRTTSKCDAPGTLAAARFTIVGGKIVAWEQIPVPSNAAPPAA